MLVKNLQQLSRTPTTSDLVGQAELRLVIRSGQHRGQRVRLMAAQSSIGSGLGCTLRAAMPGVAPLHCWLHNSGRMTSLQANGFEVIHNGRAVSHAIIQPGDTLRLGTLDLQVAECPHETIPLSPAPELSFGAGAALDAVETLVAMEASNQADDVQTSNPTTRTARDLQALRNERRIGHRRLKRALLQLREVQSRFQSLARREQDLLVANRSLSAFHTTEREELLARIAEHHQEGLNLSQQLASAEAKLRSERAESAKLLQTAQATAEELSQAQTTVAHLSQEASSKHEALQLASLDAEKAHADHEAYVKSAEKALNSIKQELARHLDEKVQLQSELIEREAHARSLEEQVIILQQQLAQQQMSAVEMPHAKHAGIDDLEIQLESERRKHEQEAAEFTAVRARLERELTCLAATVREFQAERIAMFDATSANSEEEKEAQEFARQELATMLHKRQAEQEEWTRVRTRFEQERSALQAQLQQLEQELARQKDAFATDATETQYEITQTLDAVKAELQDAAAQALSLKESLTASEEQYRLDQANWEAQQQELHQERELLRDRWESTRQEINALRKDLATKEAAIDALNLTQANLFEQLATQQTHSQLELSRLASQLRGAEARVNQTEAELEQRVAAAELESVQAQLASVEQAQLALVTERDALVAKLSAADTQLNDLRSELKARDRALEEANAQCVRLNDQLASLETESQARLDTFAAELQTVRTYLSEKEAECEARILSEDHEAVKQQLQLQTDTVENLVSEREALREQITGFTAKLQAIQEQLTNKDAELRAGSQYYDLAEQHRATADELRVERDALTEQVTSISAQVAEFQNQLDQKAAEIQVLNQQNLEAQEQIQLLATVRLERDAVGEELATMTAMVAELREQLLQKETAIEEANRLLEMETEERSEVEGRLHAERNGLSEQVTSLSQSVAELQGALATKEAELLAVKHSFDLSYQDRSKVEETNETEIQALREQMESALTQIAELQQQLARKEAELDEASRRWAMAQEQLSHTQSLIQSEAERAQAELREFKANLIAQDEQLAQAIPAETHAIIAQQLSQREDEIALLSQDQEKLCEQLLIAEQRVQELTDKLAAQDAKLEQAECSHQGEDQAFDTERLELRDEVARLKDALHLVEDQLAIQAEQPEQLSLLTTEVENLRQLLADCQLEVQQLVTERCELHSTIEKLKDEQAALCVTPEAAPTSIKQPTETPDRSTVIRTFKGTGYGKDEGRMAASAEDIRMSFAPFDWQAERERMLRTASDEASQPIDDSASSTGATEPPEIAEPPVAAAVETPAAPEESAQDVDSVLNRLMRAGVWKGSDALATSDSTSAASDSERKSEPSLSAPFAPREGFVTERFSQESFHSQEETAEDEVTEEPSGILSTSKFLPHNPSAQEAEEDDSSSVTPAPSYSHGRRAEDRAESVAPAASEPDNGTGDTDESIDSYMERLLNRVRGESATECRLSSKPQKTTTSSRTSQAPPDESQSIRTTASTVDFVDHSEYIPRSQAPEQVSQLSALRELANTAARSAIEQHAQKSRRTVSRDGNTAAIGLAVTGVVAGGVALYTGYWQAWAASGIALVSSLLLGSKLLRDALRQLKLVAATNSQEAEAEANSKSEGEELKQE